MARKPRRPRHRRRITTETDPAAAADDAVATDGADAGNIDGADAGDIDGADAGDIDGADAGDTEPETGPLRRCIVTRERLPKERMIRFVVGPDRQIVPDLAARLPGRGIWLSACRDVLESGSLQEDGRQKDKQGDGVHRHLARAFARAARGPVSVPSDLSVLLQAALIRRIGECLGLARRAGQAVAGYEKAREALRTGRYRLVLQASDGSEAERQRFLSGFGVAAAFEPACGLELPLGQRSGLTIIDPLPGEALGRVFGRDYVVHVAVAPGKLAESLVVEAGRLAGLRNGSARALGSARATGRETVPVNDETGANG
jgi:hypothetical protein